MLYLRFRLGEDRYALEAIGVQEILPVVDWKEIPQSANGILGVFNYHGEIVPLLDLAQFIIAQPSRLHMSTRIILVNTAAGESGEQHQLGLLAEGATSTFHAEPGDFVAAGVEVAEAPYLGPVLTDAAGIVQLIEVSSLLPASVKEQLFSQRLETEQVAG